ncbi:hypothetical protein Q7C18_03910 [Nesterenkonia sp. CL21]|uniref:hypothetical protein n=1 Tax=Nesterenkonia sp. CL21 TaxID=3064894 RepID=UPI00287AB164|nr:hypothetical protein [Nesterenkonia sp. CL21]MDS2171833.1 hypothetical protein [Nesterenkonia sp. CL21]
MNPTDAPRPRRRLIALIATAAIVLFLAGVGVYGLLSGPRTADAPPPAESTAPSGPVGPAPAPRELAPILETDDPEEFARHVAEALFGWDTTSGLMPLDYTSAILAVADPSGVEQAGLASDIASYLPNRATWIELRQYSTTQHLEITDVYVPGAWADAEAQAQPGQLPEGTTAYTIEGVRHRAGIWNDEPTTSEHDVAFTIFLTCPPDDADEQACYLLRLSVLDQPLR